MRESERESERENIFFLQAKFSGRERESEGICTPPDFMCSSMSVAEVRYH